MSDFGDFLALFILAVWMLVILTISVPEPLELLGVTP